MEILNQTKVTDQNKKDFFRFLYNVQSLPGDQLIDLSVYQRPIVMIDSCGWHYRDCFQDNKLILIEGVQTCKDFNIKRDFFDYLFDDRLPVPVVPRINVSNSALIIDQSPKLFKYQTVNSLHSILTQACGALDTEVARIRLPLQTLNDNHLQDRIHDLLNIVPSKYIITFVQYDLKMLDLEFRRKKHYVVSIN